VGGFKAGDADDGGDDEIHLGECGAGYGALGAVDDLNAGDPGGFEALAEGFGDLFSGEGDEAGAPADGLGEGLVDIVAGGEGGDLVAVWELLDDGEGALSDGAGGTEDG